MSHSEQRMAMIREKLEAAFAPESLEIIDESHKHAGHASAKGGGHFIVQIVSKAFEQQLILKLTKSGCAEKMAIATITIFSERITVRKSERETW